MNRKKIATALLFDREGKLLIYLRDDKPTISFPNHWDLFGGHIEEGETPEIALTREIEEELGIIVYNFKKFNEYIDEGGVHPNTKPNIKYVYWAKIDAIPEELTLMEGQELTSIDLSERKTIRFANILGKIVDDFANTNIHLLT